MNKHEVNRLLFCMKERDELKAFRDDLNNAKKTLILKEQTSKFKVITICNFEKEHSLTDIQMTKLYAFLDAEVKHLENHLANAAPEEKEIAEAIYSGEISKDALNF